MRNDRDNGPIEDSEANDQCDADLETVTETVAGSERPTTVEGLIEGIDDLAEEGSEKAVSADLEADIAETKATLIAANQEGLLRSAHRRLDPRDAVEAFVGSVIFASPLLVEDGVFDIADHLFTYNLGGLPVFLVANTLFVVLMTYALLEWTGQNAEESHEFLGVVPARVLMILVVSFLVAAVLMTVWGRVDLIGAPTEALARVNVIWTVGSLGAALGDILAHSDEPPPRPPAMADADDTEEVRPAIGDDETSMESAAATPVEVGVSTATDARSKTDLIAMINDHFDDLESSAAPADRGEVRRLREQAFDELLDDFIDEEIRKYTSRDIAEAFVGSIFFSIPFLVEDGVFDVAAYFLSFQLRGFPVYFFLNAAFVLLMVLLLVYWAGPKDVKVSRPLFGIVPRRLVGISLVSFLTAAALMAMWGRVDVYTDPLGSVARVSAVWTVASFGASLGDILPGESSGADINDELAGLSNQVEELLE